MNFLGLEGSHRAQWAPRQHQTSWGSRQPSKPSVSSIGYSFERLFARCVCIGSACSELDDGSAAKVWVAVSVVGWWRRTSHNRDRPSARRLSRPLSKTRKSKQCSHTSIRPLQTSRVFYRKSTAKHLCCSPAIWWWSIWASSLDRHWNFTTLAPNSKPNISNTRVTFVQYCCFIFVSCHWGLFRKLKVSDMISRYKFMFFSRNNIFIFLHSISEQDQYSTANLLLRLYCDLCNLSSNNW